MMYADFVDEDNLDLILDTLTGPIGSHVVILPDSIGDEPRVKYQGVLLNRVVDSADDLMAVVVSATDEFGVTARTTIRWAVVASLTVLEEAVVTR